MSFGLARGRELDDTGVGVTAVELPPLPDAALADRRAGLVDPRAWFPGPARPLEIEIGSGKGTFLVQQAQLQPGTNFLGIEWAREFYLYAADRVRRAALPNVRLLNGDATEFLHWRCPDGIARVIHLYFPDPWPKRRHHRRRTVQDRFMLDAHRVLLPGGELRIVTDHDEYWAWMQEVFSRHAGVRAPAPTSSTSDIPHPTSDIRFEAIPFDRPTSAADGELVGSNFERKYRREGRPFHAITLRKPPLT